MIYYDPEVVHNEIRAILAGERKRHPNEEHEIPIEDSLMNLFSTMTHNVYGAGMLEVRQGIIKALDLRHLLGL